MPDAAPPDMVSPAFEHMLTYGGMRRLTPEQLAEAIEIDPQQIQGLGPSIDQLRAMLEERKRKILETHETDSVRREAEDAFQQAIKNARPPNNLLKAFNKAVQRQQPIDFERLWYRADEQSRFATQVLHVNERLVERDEVDELASKYHFTGAGALDVPGALKVKAELETIDRLLQQLEQAAKEAKVYLIDMEALAEFAEEGQLENLARIQQQVEELLRHQAEEQGLISENGKLTLSPKAYRIFQSKLLDQIFSDLHASKSGRHQVELSGDGAVEMQRTKTYEYGDSLANMDTTNSMINALLRNGPGLPVRMRPDDIEIHLTRNNPKCATSVLMDMSGSMRWGGLYIDVKRMALALNGLIRSEYPGDFLDFIEIATLAKRKHVAEVVELLPKPVTIHDPVVRLRADMSDPKLSEAILPPHFTNIQHGLQLARQVLGVQDTPNRQVFVITDGLPTAHFEGSELFLLYPPHERTADETMREGLRCRDEGIVINIFLLSTWAQSREDVQFAHGLAETTGGRVIFVSGGELDRFVVWDYVKRRRLILG